MLAVHMLNQACETMFAMMKDFGYVRSVPYSEVMLFSASMAVLMSFYERGMLPDGIVKTILNKCFGIRGDRGEVEQETKSNGDATTSTILPTGQQISECNVTIARDSGVLGLKVLGLTSSLHFGYSLLTSLPKLWKKPGTQVLRSLIIRKDKLYFGAWLGSFTTLYLGMSKLLRKYLFTHGSNANSGAVAGAVAGLSMLWFRDTSYAIYISTKVLELVYMSGIERGSVPYVKNFEVLLYAACTALIFHVAVLQPLYLRPAYFGFLENLTGGRFIKMQREKMGPFGYDSMRMYELPRPNPYFAK